MHLALDVITLKGIVLPEHIGISRSEAQKAKTKSENSNLPSGESDPRGWEG